MEVLTDLDHSLLKRSSRERVSALLAAYVTNRAAGTARTDSPGRGAGVGHTDRGPAGAAARA
jgi:hypothetical protein